MRKKLLVIAIVIACLFSVFICLMNRNDGKIVLAVNMPLTGPIASITESYPEGLMAGVRDACEELGMDYSIFKFDIQDNKGQNDLSVSIFQKQALNGFDALFSGGSAQTEAILQEVKKVGKPHFLFAFDAFMTEKDENLIRVVPNFKAESSLYIKYAKKCRAKRIFAVSLNISAYEDQYSRIIEPALKDDNIQIIRERISLDFTDFRTLAARIEKESPDLIFLSTYAFQIQPMILTFKEKGLIHDGNVYSTIDYIDLFSMGMSADALKGVVFTCPVFQLVNCSPDAKKWKENWKAKHGKEPHYTAAYAYITGRILVETQKKCGNITTKSFMSNNFAKSFAGDIIMDDTRDLVSTLTVGKLNSKNEVEEVEL